MHYACTVTITFFFSFLIYIQNACFGLSLARYDPKNVVDSSLMSDPLRIVKRDTNEHRFGWLLSSALHVSCDCTLENSKFKFEGASFGPERISLEPSSMNLNINEMPSTFVSHTMQ